MRLSDTEVLLLKKELFELSTEAKLYLFGSRTDDAKKGGDIDLLIVSKTLLKKDIRVLRQKFFQHFGEQKLDIILDTGDFNDPFVKKIVQDAVPL